MRVLEVTQRYPPALGGVEDHVARLTGHLTRAGIDVDVVTSDLVRDRPFRRFAAGRGSDGPSVRRHMALPLLPLPHGLGIVAPGMVRDTLRSPADVVHAHAFGYPPTWSAALRRALTGAPVVITPHSDEGRGGFLSRTYARTMARYTLGRATRVIALTEQERRLLERLGVPAERLRVIPNGVELEEFIPRAGAVERAPTFRVLFVGRLYPEQKGLEPLLGAMERLGPPSELRLVGEDWGGLRMIREFGRRRGIGSRLIVLGALSRTELVREYHAADVIVLPSLFEPFGIVLLEAMAAGKPVVASRVGGIPEIVDDGATGLLVPPGAPPALADALNRLRADPALARQMGEAGRRRVARFSWERLAPQFVELFREAAES